MTAVTIGARRRQSPPQGNGYCCCCCCCCFCGVVWIDDGAIGCFNRRRLLAGLWLTSIEAWGQPARRCDAAMWRPASRAGRDPPDRPAGPPRWNAMACERAARRSHKNRRAAANWKPRRRPTHKCKWVFLTCFSRSLHAAAANQSERTTAACFATNYVVKITVHIVRQLKGRMSLMTSFARISHDGAARHPFNQGRIQTFKCTLI